MAPKDSHPSRRPAAIGTLRRNHPLVRRTALDWRRLTGGGGRTLVACSGGADSIALLLALALTTTDLVVAHIRHDLRPRGETDADRDVVHALADRLGLPFIETEVRVADRRGNKEALARRERYAALARLARDYACPFVATAHHADDQLETILMALTRGAGPHGLRGIAPSLPLPLGGGGESSSRGRDNLPPGGGGESSSRGRDNLPPGGGGESSSRGRDGLPLAEGRGKGHRRSPIIPSPHHSITLIRPMLRCTRAESRAACAAAGVAWCEDPTNADVSRLRAAVRARVLPILAELRPEGARRATHAAELLRDAAAIIDERVRELFGEASSWERSALRDQPALVVGLGLRRAALRLTGGRHADRLTAGLVMQAVRAIRDDSTDPREFRWPGGITLRVASRLVEISIG